MPETGPSPSSSRRGLLSLFSSSSRSPTSTTTAAAPRWSPPELALRPPRPPHEPDVSIHLPLHSIVLVNCTCTGDTGTGDPRPVRTHVGGEVEVRFPPGMRRRVMGIRLVRRTWSRLDMGRAGREKGKKGQAGVGGGMWGETEDRWEYDTLREKVVELKGAMVLEEGVHRFEFDDELEESTPFTDTVNERTPLVGTHYLVQVLGRKPETPALHPMVDLSRLETPPTYENPPAHESEAGERVDDVPWLEETFSSWRQVLVQHNPSPTGSLNILDDRFSAFVDELGLIEARVWSNEFTVAGPFIMRVSIPTPSPRVTIFAVRFSGHQVETATSPRDGFVKETKNWEPFLVMGHLPTRSVQFPGPEMPALWRGDSATGASSTNQTDADATRGWSLTKRGRFPSDMDIRASTLAGTDTPVVLTHQFEYEIFYSVYQQDADGKRLPGPGELRVVSRRKNIIMPSCCLLPELVSLPQYPLSAASGTWTDEKQAKAYLSPDRPCSACGVPPSSRICQTCSTAHSQSGRASSIPHIRHDPGPDFCSACSGRTVLPRTMPTKGIFWCACQESRAVRGKGKEDMEMPEDEVPREIMDSMDGIAAVRDGDSRRSVSMVDERSIGGAGWLQEDVMRSRSRRDHMLAVKLDGEWASKHTQRDSTQ